MAWEFKVKVSECDTSELRLKFDQNYFSECGLEIPAFVVV